MTGLKIALLCIGAFAAPRPLASQEGPVMPAQAFSEAALWQRVLTSVVSSLTTYLVRTSADTNPQPWQLTLPDNAPEPERLLRQLRTILRARPPVSSDTLLFTLVVGPIAIRNDTAYVTIRTDFGKRCPKGTALGGFGNTDRVVVPLHPRLGWGVARSEGAIHGDRGGCPGPW